MKHLALLLGMGALSVAGCSGDDSTSPSAGLGGAGGAAAGSSSVTGGSSGSSATSAGAGGVASAGAAGVGGAIDAGETTNTLDAASEHVEAAAPCPGAGMALEFDGDKHTRVTAVIGDALPLGNSSRTVEMWIYTVHNTWKAEHHMFEYGSSSPRDAAFGIDFGDGPYPQLQTYDNGAADMFFNVPTATVPETGWVHIAEVYDGDAKKISGVVNGVTAKSATLPAEMKTSTSLFSLGFSPHFSGNVGFTGKIDELRIWSTARTDAEIKSTMNVRLSGTETGLVAYFHFDEGSGTISKDAVKSYEATLLANTPPNWVPSGVMLDCK